jgi:hypothetical protein
MCSSGLKGAAVAVGTIGLVLSIIGLISTSVGVAEFTSMTEVDGMLKEEVEKLAVTDEGKREAMNDVRVVGYTLLVILLLLFIFLVIINAALLHGVRVASTGCLLFWLICTTFLFGLEIGGFLLAIIAIGETSKALIFVAVIVLEIVSWIIVMTFYTKLNKEMKMINLELGTEGTEATPFSFNRF